MLLVLRGIHIPSALDSQRMNIQITVRNSLLVGSLACLFMVEPAWAQFGFTGGPRYPNVPFAEIIPNPTPMPPPDEISPEGLCAGFCPIIPAGYQVPHCGGPEPRDYCNGMWCGPGLPPWLQPLPGGGGN